MKDPEIMTIRPHMLIRVLGSIVAFVVVFPSAFALLYAITHIDAVTKDPLALAFPLIIAPIGMFFGYRWFRMGGKITRDEIILNGWIYSKRIPKYELNKISEQRVRTSSDSNAMEDLILLMDKNEVEIAKVPNSLNICRKYKQFIRNLHHVAQFNREHKNHGRPSSSNEISIQDKPVDEWTAEDIERYEQEN